VAIIAGKRVLQRDEHGADAEMNLACGVFVIATGLSGELIGIHRNNFLTFLLVKKIGDLENSDLIVVPSTIIGTEVLYRPKSEQ
jgi:hypothetical protein